MTVLKVSCPTCGDVLLETDEVRFVAFNVADRSFYEFTCRTCLDLIRKPACPNVARLLTLGGVVPERVVVPPEALEPHYGRPLTDDDVLDFTLDLRQLHHLADFA